MRGILGEESGLLPVGLQGETERRVKFKLSAECGGGGSFVVFSCSL